MPREKDWDWLAVNSHYQTATAVQECLRSGDAMEAIEDRPMQFPCTTAALQLTLHINKSRLGFFPKPNREAIAFISLWDLN
ncbi:MAG: hypothetical protein AB4352_11520 [Hormoscilla sp.]